MKRPNVTVDEYDGLTALLLATDADGLRPVFGMPAVRRLVIILRRAGIERIHIIGLTRPLVPVIGDLLTPEAFHPMDNPALLEKLSQEPAFHENDRLLALRADLVVDGDLLGRMATAAAKARFLFMPAKGGASFDGIYVTAKSDVLNVLQTLWHPASDRLPPVNRYSSVQGFAGLPCRAAGQGEGKISPEAALVRALGRHTEADDGFMARHVDRRVSRFFSSRLSHGPVSPNQITIAGMSIGLLGAFCLALPGYWSRLLGAFLFVLCVVIDGVDGEVARLKLMETTFGHRLDIVTDNIVHVAVFAGIAIGLYHQTGNRLYIHALMFLIGGFALAAVTVYYCILRRTSGGIRQPSRSLRLMALMANRDFAYLVLFFAALNRIDWFFLATAAGVYIFTALLLTLGLLEIRQARRQLSAIDEYANKHDDGLS